MLEMVAGAVFGYILEHSEIAESARTILMGDPAQHAFKRVLGQTLADLKAQYPDLSASLFDEYFLEHAAAPVLAQCLTVGPSPSPEELARAWFEQFPQNSPNLVNDRVIKVAESFLRSLEIRLRNCHEFRELFQSQDIFIIRETTTEITELLRTLPDRFIDGPARYLASKRESDESYPTSSYDPPFDVEFLPVPEHFVGRTEDLDWILAQMQIPNSSKIIAILGMGGIGKSSLAAVAIQALHASKCFPDGIAVVNCSGKTEGSEVFRELLARFRVYPSLGDLSQHNQLTETVRNLLHGKRILIVLDDIEPSLDINQVLQFLRMTNVALLLTARHQLPAEVVPRKRCRILNLLSNEEALQYMALSLGRASPDDLGENDRTACQHIIAALDRHTLAINLASAYAADYQRNLTTLAQELDDPHHALNLPKEEIPHAMRGILSRSINALPEDAKRLFMSLGAFVSGDFGRKAAIELARGLSNDDPQFALGLLVRRSLIIPVLYQNLPGSSDCERFRIHRLIHACATEQFMERPENEQNTILQHLGSFYAYYTASQSNVDEIWAIGPDEVNILHCLEWALRNRNATVFAGICIGMQYYWRFYAGVDTALQYLPIGTVLAKAIATLTCSLRDRMRAANLSLSYAHVLQNTGMLAEAERVLHTNLKMRQELGDRRGESAVLSTLAYNFKYRGLIADAIEVLEEALVIDRELGDRHGEGSDTITLGQLALETGNFEQANCLLQEALNISREVQSRREEGIALSSLGQTAWACGMYDKAQEFLDQSLEIRRQLRDRRSEGVDLLSLGQIAISRDRLDEAKSYAVDALSILQSMRDRRNEATAQQLLGQIAVKQGKMPEAEAYFRASQDLDRDIGDRQGEGVSIISQAQVLLKKGQPQAAERLFEEGLALVREVQDRQDEAIAMMGLGEVAIVLRRFEEADKHYRNALSIFQAMGDSHGMGISYGKLADVAGMQKEYPAAESLYRQALSSIEQTQDRVILAQLKLALGVLIAKHRGNHDEGCVLISDAVRLHSELGQPLPPGAGAVIRQIGCQQ